MPKALTKPQPSSSVAKMLEPNVGVQVIARPEHVATPILPVPVQTIAPPRRANQDAIQPSGEVPDVPRQFTLTARTDRKMLARPSRSPMPGGSVGLNTRIF